MDYDYTCYFDGACQPKNPGGAMGIGALIKNDIGLTIDSQTRFVAPKPNNTNNVAEYMALIWVLNTLIAGELAGKNVLILGDSKLVIEQMNCRWDIKKGDYVPYAKRAQEMFYDLRINRKVKIDVQWIPREQNTEADALSTACFKDNKINMTDFSKFKKKKKKRAI